MIVNESQTFSKENVRQVQGNQEKRQDSRYLRQPQAQAAPGLIRKTVRNSQQADCGFMASFRGFAAKMYLLF